MVARQENTNFLCETFGNGRMKKKMSHQRIKLLSHLSTVIGIGEAETSDMLCSGKNEDVY